jgi:acyl-CoA thioesterase FadM
MSAEEYTAVFARAREHLIVDQLGLSDTDELARFRVIQSSSQYRRPLHAGDTYRVDARMLGWRPCYLHVFFQLWHGQEIAVACQQLLQYTDGQEPHAGAMPAQAQTGAARLFRNQEGLPLPLGTDANIALP